MVKVGCRVAISILPFRYLYGEMTVVSGYLLITCGMHEMKGFSYPIANVLQSVSGARAVIGSKIVRVETCSEVDGSKRMTLPCEFPI